ncbi:MAG: histidine phosphatase family protein [Nannocystaceae bacterium]
MSEILFVRHGQASLLKTYYDDLSDQGREQATGLGRFLAEHEWTFDAVVSGPARRHLDTANAIGKAVAERQQPWPQLETLAGLDEHDNLSLVRASVGSLSDDAEVVALRRDMLEASGREERSERFGRLFEAVVIRWLQGDFEPQGVETWTQFRARVLSCIEAMTTTEPARRLLVISSLGPLAVLLQRALELDDAAAFRLAWRARNTSLTTFGFDARGRLSLDAFNALPHMPDRASWTLR